jgi:hypothetical protein
MARDLNGSEAKSQSSWVGRSGSVAAAAQLSSAQLRRVVTLERARARERERERERERLRQWRVGRNNGSKAAHRQAGRHGAQKEAVGGRTRYFRQLLASGSQAGIRLLRRPSSCTREGCLEPAKASAQLYSPAGPQLPELVAPFRLRLARPRCDASARRALVLGCGCRR